MASPAEIGQPLPETLPEDFGDWDSQPSRAPIAADSGGPELQCGLEVLPEPPAATPRYEVSAEAAAASLNYAGVDVARTFGVVPKPPAQTAEPELDVTSRPGGFGNSALLSPARSDKDEEAFLHKPKSTSPVTPALPMSISHVEGVAILAQQAQAQPDFDEFLESLRPKIAAMQVEGDPRKRRWIMIAAISACSILVLSILAFWLFSSGTPSTTKASDALGSAKAEAKLTNGTPKPSPSTPSIPEKSPAPPQTQQAQLNTPTPVSPTSEADTQEIPPAVQPKMMNDQLAAPVRISREIKKPAAGNEPPPAGFSAADASVLGSGAAIPSVFSKAPPVVHAPPPNAITISAGVAGGLLIQKTPPVYPAIAKSARVSGTVQVQATISKDGTVKDLRVVGGPAMLRQAAMDAVRTWRYKPYRLSNQPTEVQTTINVIFSLGG